MKLGMKRPMIGLALAATLLAPGLAGAQDSGTISGTVTDATGFVLPGVTVEARDAAGVGEVTFTDGAGQFTFSGLAPGTYEVIFTLPGFDAPAQVVEVGAGVTATVDVEMDILLQETVAVVGTRAEPRSIAASPVPIDVITAQDFTSQGDMDLTNQLRTVVPSFNVNTQPISDAATIVRPANLRNMAPDHTLILVNGKRRHRAAVIAWLGNGVADGAQGPDLSSIPSIALRQVEVLRDGAAAQYGSDAIAGVINFELKNARSGGSMELRSGQYFDQNDGTPATCGPVGRSCNGIGGRAPSYTFAGNAGLPLGPEGFLNLSLEYGGVQPTNRAVQDGGTMAVINGGNTNVRDTSRVWGVPLVEDDLKLFANFGSGGEQAEFYGHTSYASKVVTGGFYFRNPNNRGNVYSVDGGETLLVGDVLQAQGMGSANCPTVNITNGTPDPVAFAAVRDDPNCFTFHQPFLGAQNGLPGGFTPQFGGDVYDYSLVSGVRGTTMTGVNWDISGSTGRNHVQTFIFDTVNASLGPESPTRFEPNLLQQTETSLNADVSFAASDMINVAGGVEWRNEQYHLGEGDPASWAIGPFGAQGFSSASNGYNGTRPENAGTWDRANVAGYGDIEIHGVDNEWNLGAAVRIEDFYDSFGTTMNSKLSGRYGFTDIFAARAAVSSGFRAPTPGQQNVLNVTTEFDYKLGDLINNGTIPSTSPVAALRGGVPLQPEQSINYSLGTVVDTGPFTFTADYFRINVSDRLTITRNYSLSPDEVATLLAGGIAEAGNLAAFRFFVNDFSTRTQGLDLVATWTPLALGARTTFSGVFNFTDTEVTEFGAEHIDQDRIAALTMGLPRMRWNMGMNHSADRWTLMARLHYYGSYWDREDARSALGGAMSYLYPLYSGKPLVDLEVGFPFSDFTLSVGAQNIFNTYPDENPGAVAGVGNRYGQFGPFGFNGGYYYTRVSFGWGG
ncbi:MAG: TonB-dependent receptor [Acidobacteria bacterium]|nr:TonB-dependent receptor [Acidobacteriota bacterium]